MMVNQVSPFLTLLPSSAFAITTIPSTMLPSNAAAASAKYHQ